MLSATVPIWMAEVVPAKIRGPLVDLHGAMYIFGYMLAAWVGYGFYFVDSADSWRGPFGKHERRCALVSKTHKPLCSSPMLSTFGSTCRDLLAP